MNELKELVQKQELLIKLYQELFDISPNSRKDKNILETKMNVAKEELLKNNFEIKKELDRIRKEA
ncbi:hypothetical protein C0585_06115 [Candidatus Woesearchaeota archaeon]|nr:MAG: hypothetical protein C0585_06115 [Candidatus Woesearchaeota archaeon]